MDTYLNFFTKNIIIILTLVLSLSISMLLLFGIITIDFIKIDKCKIDDYIKIAAYFFAPVVTLFSISLASFSLSKSKFDSNCAKLCLDDELKQDFGIPTLHIDWKFILSFVAIVLQGASLFLAASLYLDILYLYYGILIFQVINFGLLFPTLMFSNSYKKIKRKIVKKILKDKYFCCIIKQSVDSSINKIINISKKASDNYKNSEGNSINFACEIFCLNFLNYLNDKKTIDFEDEIYKVYNNTKEFIDALVSNPMLTDSERSKILITFLNYFSDSHELKNIIAKDNKPRSLEKFFKTNMGNFKSTPDPILILYIPCSAALSTAFMNSNVQFDTKILCNYFSLRGSFVVGIENLSKNFDYKNNILSFNRIIMYAIAEFIYLYILSNPKGNTYKGFDDLCYFTMMDTEKNLIDYQYRRFIRHIYEIWNWKSEFDFSLNLFGFDFLE